MRVRDESKKGNPDQDNVGNTFLASLPFPVLGQIGAQYNETIYPDYQFLGVRIMPWSRTSYSVSPPAI